MAEDKIQIIKKLLDRLFIFRAEDGERILAKASAGLTDEKFALLRAELMKAIEWQKELTVEKMKKDPTLYERIMKERGKLAGEVIKTYEEKVREEDRNKINLIISKINDL